MTEKPILFNTEMVKAILDGRKTQTRRVIKPQPINEKPHLEWGWAWRKSKKTWFSGVTLKQLVSKPGLLYHSPYGKPGDELWVRETWRPSQINGKVWYKAGEWLPYIKKYKTVHESYKGIDGTSKWRPSIHMPRRASRIQLTVKDVRVERVTDITEDDAKAEGMKFDLQDASIKYSELYNGNYTLVHKFYSLWNSINGSRGYGVETNPWVWVIEFELLTKV